MYFFGFSVSSGFYGLNEMGVIFSIYYYKIYNSSTTTTTTNNNR